MIKVYFVGCDYGEGHCMTCGIFSTREKAEEYISREMKRNDSNMERDHWEIEEIILDSEWE